MAQDVRRGWPRRGLVSALVAGLLVALTLLPGSLRAAPHQTAERPAEAQLKAAILAIEDVEGGFSVRNEGKWKAPWAADFASYGRELVRGSLGRSDELLAVILVDAAVPNALDIPEAYVRRQADEFGVSFERAGAPDIGQHPIRFILHGRDYFGTWTADVLGWQHEGVSVLMTLFSRRNPDATPYALRQQAKLVAVFGPSAAAPAGATATVEAVTIARGCTGVTATWPDGTPLPDIAAAVTPPEALVAIWRVDPVTGRVAGWSPRAAAISDLTTVRRLDPLVICTSAPATIGRPQTG